jgi:hypothetical protein
MNHPALSRAFHAKRRSTANYESYLSIVADEPKFAEFVHEEADAGSGRSNHLSQCLLADIQWNGLRHAFRSEMREQKKKAGEPPLA